MSLPHALCALHVLKRGWGEAALRFALRCAQAGAPRAPGAEPEADGGATATEAALWTALTWASSGGGGSGGGGVASAGVRANLRKAWRSCTPVPPPPPPTPPAVAAAEEEEQEEQVDGQQQGQGQAPAGAEGGGEAPPAPAPAAGGGGGGHGAADAVKGAEPPRVACDEFVAKLQADPVLAGYWLREVGV